MCQLYCSSGRFLHNSQRHVIYKLDGIEVIMGYYKDTNNKLHFLEDNAYAYLLPAGAIQITEAEADAIRAAELTNPPPVPVITSVTMRQARLALLQQGLLTQVNNAVASMPGAQGDAVRIEWEFSSTVERNRPLVQSLSATLGMTSQQLDDLFALAATL
jgi:hypothetical protein